MLMNVWFYGAKLSILGNFCIIYLHLWWQSTRYLLKWFISITHPQNRFRLASSDPSECLLSSHMCPHHSYVADAGQWYLYCPIEGSRLVTCDLSRVPFPHMNPVPQPQPIQWWRRLSCSSYITSFNVHRKALHKSVFILSLILFYVWTKWTCVEPCAISLYRAKRGCRMVCGDLRYVHW